MRILRKRLRMQQIALSILDALSEWISNADYFAEASSYIFRRKVRDRYICPAKASNLKPIMLKMNPASRVLLQRSK